MPQPLRAADPDSLSIRPTWSFSRQEKSYSLTLQVHNDGKGIVWSGTLEVAELKRDQIRSAGPDFYATKKVDFPLKATVEPLPG